MPLPYKYFVKALTVIILTLFSLWNIACSKENESNLNVNTNASAQKTNSINSNSVKDDAAELATIVQLPETPEEAKFIEEETANPKGKKLTAVLRFSSDSTAKIIAASQKDNSSDVEIGTENWFPEELIAQSQISGSESLKATSYSANSFFNPPYLHGKLMHIKETDYFVLELTNY